MAAMANFAEQLEEIKICIALKVKPVKISAYLTLRSIRKQISTNNSLIQSLAESFHALLSSILVDVNHIDKEIAVLALKSLGFMISHPPILAQIPEDEANTILNSLVDLIKTTRIKAVHNFGVWCVSTQQFSSTFLASRFDFLLDAIVHALNNSSDYSSPNNAALRAVTKLATQLSQEMREASYIWAPLIYRRLVSHDVREVVRVKKCLLNIRSTLLPPPLFLSKVIVVDLKENLINSMNELVNNGNKIRALQAWEFYIRLIGNDAVMKQNLVNEMIKVLTQASSLDSQVQNAALVAWEGLIDALIQQEKPPEVDWDEISAEEITRRINQIMTPFFGILSYKFDSTVHLLCLRTWSYLLRKVSISGYSPTVINSVCFPIFELVFKLAPSIQSIPLWNFCFDILGDEKLTGGQWFSWHIGPSDFFIKMADVMISHTLNRNLESDMKDLACSAALRIFRFVLIGIQNISQNSSTGNKGSESCLNATLTLLKKICEDIPQFSLQFLESVTEQLEDTVLESTQHKLPLNLTNSDIYGSLGEFPDDTVMVLPIEYVALLFFGVFDKSPGTESKKQGTFEKFKLVSCSWNPEVMLNTGIRLLRSYSSYNSLNLWDIIVKCLQDYIISMDISSSNYDISRLKTSFDIDKSLRILCYPFTVIQKENKIEIKLVVRVWKSLFETVLCASIKCSCKSFPEDLIRMLNEILDESTDNFDAGESRFVSLCESILTYLLLEFKDRFTTLTLKNPKMRFSLPLGIVVFSLDHKEHFLSFENFSSLLIDWLSSGKRQKDITDFHLLNFTWSTILISVEHNMSMRDRDSSFLAMQSNLLSKTLNHPIRKISSCTIDFWNAVYAQENLDYPEILLPVMKKLLRATKIFIPESIQNEKLNGYKRYRQSSDDEGDY